METIINNRVADDPGFVESYAKFVSSMMTGVPVEVHDDFDLFMAIYNNRYFFFWLFTIFRMYAISVWNLIPSFNCPQRVEQIGARRWFGQIGGMGRYIQCSCVSVSWGLPVRDRYHRFGRLGSKRQREKGSRGATSHLEGGRIEVQIGSIHIEVHKGNSITRTVTRL